MALTFHYLVVACGLALVCSVGHAAVYKCQGADGRPVYRDTACSTDQTGAVVPRTSSAGPAHQSTPSAKVEEGADLVKRAQRAQVQEALTPECQALGDKASEALRQDSASLNDVKRAVGEFERRCGDQVEKAMRLGASAPHRPPKLGEADCRKLRDLLTESRAQLGKMADKEKMAYAKLQNEVSVACP
jgi:hypothetical protein